MIKVDVFAPGDDEIGEGPLWSQADQALYWIDIARKHLRRKRLAEIKSVTWALPDYPGCLAELAPEKIAVAMGEGVQQVNLNTGVTDLLWPAPPRRAGTRFNDGKVDPKGRLWAGTMRNNFGSNADDVPIDRFDGALYRFTGDGRVETIQEEIGIPNTLAWSPDGTRFYFGDSLKERIDVYDFDLESGTLRNRRIFYDAPGHGIPDGSAIDVDGCLWNARWDGAAVVKITPDGKLDRVIELPALRPTSCAFGGADLKTLLVTSATHGMTAAQCKAFPLSGSVFAIDGAGQGTAVPHLRAAQLKGG